MPRTEPKYLMIYFFGSGNVQQKPSYLFVLIRRDLEFFAAIQPLTLVALILQGNDDHIGIIVSPQNMFVGVDEIVREIGTDFFHIFFGVDRPFEKVIDAMHSALHGEGALFLKVFHFWLHDNLVIGLKDLITIKIVTFKKSSN